MNIEYQYLELLNYILRSGDPRMDRTGTGTRAIFGPQLRHRMDQGFPVFTTKRVNYRAAWYELLWFLRAEPNIKYLLDNGVHIWDNWADEDGNVGPIYGVQWRKWPRIRLEESSNWLKVHKGQIDQLQDVIEGLKVNPTSRRHIVTTWNPAEIDSMALPPCHILFQFFVRGGQYLDIQVYQRSADMIVGIPFDIITYSTLLYMVAHLTFYTPGELIYNLGDAHIYADHVDAAQLLLSRDQRALPEFKIVTTAQTIDEFSIDNFWLLNYDPHPAIKVKVSV